MSYLPELRASLVQAAERQAREPAAPRRSRGWFGVAASVAVAVAVVALAILLVGRAPSHKTVPSGSSIPASWPKVPPPPPTPNPTPAQWTLIEKARNVVVTRDRRCSTVLRLPAEAQGSPSPQMLALLGVLRRPATLRDALPMHLFPHGTPLDLYVRAVRLALQKNGHALYILPTANPGFRPVPGRCLGEERAALVRLMKGAPPAQVGAAVAAQHSYLTWQQYEARHPEQVCLAEVDRSGLGIRNARSSLGCGWGLAEIEEGQAGLGSPGVPDGQVFHGIVPNGVAGVDVLQPRRAQPLTAMVVNNVFLVELQRGAGNPTRIVWRAAGGQVIKTIRVP